MPRLLALWGAAGVIALLAYLTLRVAVKHGVDVLVVVSLVVLVILGIGVLGALGSDD